MVVDAASHRRYHRSRFESRYQVDVSAAFPSPLSPRPPFLFSSRLRRSLAPVTRGLRRWDLPFEPSSIIELDTEPRTEASVVALSSTSPSSSSLFSRALCLFLVFLLVAHLVYPTLAAFPLTLGTNSRLSCRGSFKTTRAPDTAHRTPPPVRVLFDSHLPPPPLTPRAFLLVVVCLFRILPRREGFF